MLEVSNLDCYYGEKRVLENVTFSVNRGESFGVVGPNGSGKTTLLKCISGVLKPRSGIVRLNGRVVQDLSEKEIARNIAVVPQSSAVDFDFSAQEMVRMGRYPHISRFRMERQEDHEIVKRAMEITNTEHLGARRIRTLSGGELQRVIIAQALAQQPKLVLLDEPTVHLDIGHQLEIMTLIKKLNRDNGLTVISVFHDLNLAAQYCERLMLLDCGKVSSIGSPHQVLTSENIQKTYRINVLVKRHPLTSALYIIPYTSTTRRPASGKTKVHIICGGGSGAQLMRLLYEEGYALTAGVLNVLDSDYETARLLDIPKVDEAPFSVITDDSYRQNLKLIFDSDIVILADAVFGEGNLRNLEAAKNALDKGITLILVESTPFAERNFAGKAGEKLYNYIKQKAETVQKLEDVLHKIDSTKERKCKKL